VIITDGLGTLCRRRMIVMMFIGMDVVPDIVRRNAHRLVTVFMPSYVSYSSARTNVPLRSVAQYRPSQLLFSLTS
jgi:hypothetical protein